MKIKQVFLFFQKEVLMSRATIDVPGLGDVQFDSALSNRVCEEIFAESIAALRVKLGQIVVTDETPNADVTGLAPAQETTK